MAGELLGPTLLIYFHSCDWSETDQALLESWAQAALPLCLEACGPADCDLLVLTEVEVSIISDEEISIVHGKFLGDPTPTDVITFHHGEILVSGDTAKEAAAELGHDSLEEILLYIIHGLLHLNGHLDHEEGERWEMHRVQNQIWREALGKS